MNDVKISKPRGRPRSFDVETALDAAMEIFWRLGYEAATLPDLTSAMGISAQSFYAAYGSKQACYYRALERYTDGAGSGPSQAIVGQPDVVTGIEAMLLRTAKDFRRRGRPAGCMVATGSLDVTAENDAVGTYLARLRRRRQAGLEKHLRVGLDTGQLSPDTDVAALARYLATVVQGMSVQARDGATAAELRGIARLAIVTVRAARSPGPAG